jgi:gamma-glutamylcyclotransferase (GGCT)/AIG2-like uncharacterized protein YtfP
MLQKFKEQLPAIIITAALVIGAAYLMNRQTVQQMDTMAQAQLATQREEFDARLKAATDDTRRQIQAVDTLLKDAIERRAADVFMTDEEVARLNEEKVNQLAEAIAQKVQPYNPLPKTPEEAEQMQNEQIDRVSGRMVDRIQPILDEMSADQNLTRESIATYSQRISDQVGRVLTSELAKNQQLNNNLMTTQAIAEDSLNLSHELTALYLSNIKDQGLLTRLLSLPANVVRDTASMSIVNNSERKQIEEELMAKMADIERRLEDIRAQAPKR